MASPIRREGMSRYRTITIAVLVVGGAVALLAGIVSSWPARFGLAVVVLAGWVAVTYAWREITETRLVGHLRIPEPARVVINIGIGMGHRFQRGVNDQVELVGTVLLFIIALVPSLDLLAGVILDQPPFTAKAGAAQFIKIPVSECGGGSEAEKGR